jgi:hypothetical protein
MDRNVSLILILDDVRADLTGKVLEACVLFGLTCDEESVLTDAEITQVIVKIFEEV